MRISDWSSDVCSSDLTVTPSLVMRGAPKLFSMTTLRPLGPSVTLTAFASVSTPRSMRSRASDENLTSFAAIAATPFYVLPECSRDWGGRSGRLLERDDVVDDTEDIALLHDEQILAVDLDLGPRPFAEQDPIASLHRQLDERAVVVAGAGPNGDNLAF